NSLPERFSEYPFRRVDHDLPLTKRPLSVNQSPWKSRTDGLFDHLVWNALHTIHARFAVSGSTAVRYPADVVPLAALADRTHSDLSPLEELLAPGERVYLIGPQPQATRKLNVGPPLHCFQMLFPSPPPSQGKASEVQILRLTPEDAPAMVALTDLAFPGFFRPRTNEMGTY